MASPELHILIEEYLIAQLSGERHEELRKEILLPHNRAELELVMRRQYNEDAFTGMEDARLRERIFERILKDYKQLATPAEAFKTATGSLSPIPSSYDNITPPVRSIHFLKTTWFRYAAVLLLIAGTVTFLYLNNQPAKDITLKKPSRQQDIGPGGNKATLTLADGSTILLDSAAIGNLATQGSTRILKLDAGSLAYKAGSGNQEVAYNTISTPKGGQYQITLPDGSKVWLNAASSIRFPTAFITERKVTVTGEVYMEVLKDKAKPFMVMANDIEVQVLGTAFNINAYTDEKSIKTTLLEGSVRVKHLRHDAATQVILKPGQQAQLLMAGGTNSTVARAGREEKLAAARGLEIVDHADIEKVMAWKNGVFNFENAGLEEVMRQLSRWYNIEIVYEKGVPDIKFGGEVNRNTKLSELLKGLEMAEVHFRIEEGRRLVVLP